MPVTQSPARVWLLGGSTAGTIAGVTTGTSIPIYAQAQSSLTFFLRSIGTTSGGTVLIEEADWADDETPYSGTWSQLQSIAASTFTGGVQLAVHIAPNSYGYLRARISSTITGGGSITVALRYW